MNNRETYLGQCVMCGCTFSSSIPINSGFPLCQLHEDMTARERVDAMQSSNAKAAAHCKDISPGSRGDGSIKYKADH
jgi:hypothetical protein